MAKAAPESGNTLGMALCKALGIDPVAVQRVAIVCSATGAATVEITRDLLVTETPAVLAALGHYQVTPTNPPPGSAV